jgi:glycine hydroxymethyltransferase
MVTRGLGSEDFREIGEIIGVVLGPDFESQRGELLDRVAAIVERYPLYAELAAHAAV